MKTFIKIIYVGAVGVVIFLVGKSQGWWLKKPNTNNSGTALTSSSSADSNNSDTNTDSKSADKKSSNKKSTINSSGVDTSTQIGVWRERGGDIIYAKRYGNYATGTYAVGFLEDGSQVYSYYLNEGTENEAMTYSLSADSLVLY